MFCFEWLNFIVFEYLLNIHTKNFNFAQNLGYNLLLQKESVLSISFIFKIYFYFLLEYWFPRWLSDKYPPTNARDSGSIPGLGRSPGEGNGNPLQYSCLDNPMDRGAWGLQPMGSQRVGCDWAHTCTHAHTHVRVRTHTADLQCCVSFTCTAKWVSYIYTYMHSFFRFFSHIGYYRVLNRVPHIVYF